MTDKLIIHPDEEPVTLAEMRAMLGIVDDDDTGRDTVIALRIISVRNLCETYTRRAFVTQTWTRYADRFASAIDLKSDLQTINSVKYIDTNGALQTLDPAIYSVNTVDHRLELAYGQTWPDTRFESNAVRVEYVCGYGDPDEVPEPIKDAIKFWVAQWENYQSSIEGAVSVRTMPYAVEQILRQYKDFRGSI